ncbi:hypothetical protein ElyMa_000137900 [Elysia marginata]|uniref:CABIT domain-containing protein n=1 Tax=Elysia marginata TaxID=1093978 RepID=A0AAV4EQD7_9GAST|nr:hypothetical protein ElyMa_000137900 [Elysia marginata]
MGLSRKLGTSGARAAEPEGTAIPYKWSTQTYTMAELMSRFKLPCVVQCATDSCSVVWSDFQFDLRQPLLLFEKRTVKKVHAMSVSVPKTRLASSSDSNPDSAEPLEEVGPPMAIPCDYDGWFGAAPKGQSKTIRHTRVEGIAKSTARRFLVTTKLPAFTSSRSLGGAGSGDLDGYVPHDILPGEVLKRICLLDPSPGDPDCPAIVRQNGPCLECLDEKDEDVLIPLSRRALLYEIAELYPDDMNRVFTMGQVVAAGNKQLPRVLKLAHGDPPLLAYAFTGMLRCYSVFTEETILAATLDDVSSICLELSTDSCAKFRLCLNEASVKRTCEYVNAQHMCDTFGAKFITGIKVSFSLQPEMIDLDDVDMSFYESQTSVSDMQEVEANSEFDISWGAVKKAKLYSPTTEDDHQQNEIDKDSDSSSDGGLSETRGDNKGDKKGDDADIYAVVKKIRPADLSSSQQQQREFTEKQIADLMQRKGMIATIGERDDSKTNSALEENMIKHNPLFYYFQREAEEERESSDLANSGKSAEETQRITVSDTLGTHAGPDFQPTEDKLPDIITAPLDLNVTGVESEAEDLDTSVYEQVVCTPAREYSEDEVAGSVSSESDDDSDILCRVSQKTKTEFPIEANVVIRSMARQAKRNDANSLLNNRGKIFETSSSDDVNSDLERLNESESNKRIRQLLLHKNRNESHGEAWSDTKSSKTHKNTEKKTSLKGSSPSTKGLERLGLVNETSIEGNFPKSNATSEDTNYITFKPNPLRPTFTEVEDPLEGTMSELDKITSIKPSGLRTDKSDSDRNLQDFSAPQKHVNSSPKNACNVKCTDIHKNGSVQGNLVLFETSSRTKQRPEPPKGPNKKHADVMQEEDRFDSPKVSHHPHIHPHITSATKHYPPEALHLGQWTKPVPLGGAVAGKDCVDNGLDSLRAKSKVSSSVQSFERLNSSTGAGSNTDIRNDITGQKPALIFTSEKSKSINQNNIEIDTNTHQSQGLKEGTNSVQKENENTTALSRSFKSCDLPQEDVSEDSHTINKLSVESDSDEDVTTIEEHFVVSADSIKPPGSNLKVLPVYHEDLNPENFV